MWSKETILQIVQTKRFAVVAATVVSTAIGSAGGYIFAKKRLEKKYADLAEREIQEAKLFYSVKAKTGKYADPTELAAKYENENPDVMSEEDAKLMDELKEAITELQYAPGAEVVVVSDEEKIEVAASIQKNVFDGQKEATEIFDLDAELDKKANNEPYIIEEEEYVTSESGYKQTELTWYEGDETLMRDDDESIVPNVRQVVGEGNLRFGYGTTDTHVVYIRNDKYRAEYEVTRSGNKYGEEIGGFIQHEDKPGIRKFRDFD